MAREIDPKDLQDGDHQYLNERPWMKAEFRRQGFNDEMDAVDKSGAVVPGNPYEDSRVHLTDLTEGVKPGRTLDRPAPNGVVQGDDEDEIVDDNYEDWTVEELQAEIDLRNKEEDRQAQLSKAGKKAELVDRLHKDDEAGLTNNPS